MLVPLLSTILACMMELVFFLYMECGKYHGTGDFRDKYSYHHAELFSIAVDFGECYVLEYSVGPVSFVKFMKTSASVCLLHFQTLYVQIMSSPCIIPDARSGGGT